MNALGTQRILTHEEALDHAKRRIEELRLAENPQCAALRHPDVEVLKPLLVADDSGAEPTAAVPHYYIVPFAIRETHEGLPAPMVRMCVLVSAHTGEFEEATTFQKPVPYLTKEEAILRVAHELNISIDAMPGVEASLMYRSCQITRLRAYPFWRVAWGDRHYYVSQAGKVYDRIERGVPGS